jgi:hypothetical protein
VAVTLQEFSVTPAQASAPAGRVTFQAKNTGPEDEHELVVIRTDRDPGDLPTKSDGSVNEEGAGLDAVGEIEEFKVGTTQSKAFDLAAGSYVLICNVVEKDKGQDRGPLPARHAHGLQRPVARAHASGSALSGRRPARRLPAAPLLAGRRPVGQAGHQGNDRRHPSAQVAAGGGHRRTGRHGDLQDRRGHAASGRVGFGATQGRRQVRHLRLPARQDEQERRLVHGQVQEGRHLPVLLPAALRRGHGGHHHRRRRRRWRDGSAATPTSAGGTPAGGTSVVATPKAATPPSSGRPAIYWAGYGLFALGALIALVTLFAYVRYAPRFRRPWR